MMPANNCLANGQTVIEDTFFGLVNWEGRYLTAEKFGNQINVRGAALRKKQHWTLVQDQDTGPDKGYLMSIYGTMIETDKHGNVACEATEKTQQALLEVCIQSDGQWALRDIYGKYLAGNSNRLYFTSDQRITGEAVWAIHIALHPQVNMRSVSRKRYVHLEDDEMVANEDIPWGPDAVIILEFQSKKYALRDSRGMYLDGETGDLVEKCTDSCLFVISLHKNLFAFTGINGKYLTVYGPKGRLVANKTSIGKDEVFALEDSKTQVILTASNGKKLSIKQGIDVKANQSEAEDTETFQIEFLGGKLSTISMLATNGKFWSAANKSITATAKEVDPSAKFSLEWHDGNKVAFKASNGKYISSTSGGQLQPIQEKADESALFLFQLVNRPTLVLRCEHGYVDKTASSKILCNRGSYDLIRLVNKGTLYQIGTSNGKFWCVDDDGSLVSKPNGELFTLELREHTKVVIKASNGNYLKGDHNGSITACAESVSDCTSWEL